MAESHRARDWSDAGEPVSGPPPARTGARRQRWSVVATRVVDWVFYLIYGILALRFLLTLLGAREAAGFTRFVHAISGPFYGPFEGIVARPAADGGLVDFPVLLAILAYGVLHLAVRGLIRVVSTRTA